MEDIIFKEDTIDSLKKDIKERAELVFVKTGQPLIYNVNILKNMAERLANMLSEPTTEQQTSEKVTELIPDVIERFKAVEEAMKLVYSRDIGKLSLLNRLEELGKELNIETSL